MKTITKTEQKFGGGVNRVDYKGKIIELVEKIENPAILKLIYGLVKSGHAEEKAGSE